MTAQGPTVVDLGSADSKYLEATQGAALLRSTTHGGHPVDTTQPAFPSYHRKLANPGPLGLSAFALTTFVLSLINVKASGVTNPSIAVSLAFGYGGLIQILAGIFEGVCGNTFAFTAFSSYGGFWLSFGWLLSPWSGIVDSYTTAAELEHAIGFFLFGWFIFTFLMFFGTLRASIALASVFFFLTITFLFLSVAKFNPAHPHLATIGGAFGLVTAACAAYTAMAGIITAETSYFILPVGSLARED